MTARRKRPAAYVVGTVAAPDAPRGVLPAVLWRDGRCVAQAYPDGRWQDCDPATFDPRPEETP